MTETPSQILARTDPNRPVLIAGPTASGKSGFALELAQAQGRAVINADALQVFAGWHILTARPSPADCALAPHLLYGHVPAHGSYSVGDWLRDLAPLLAQRPAPIIVGGTGLYFQALLNGLADIPGTDPAMRARAQAQLERDGLAAMIAELDPPTRAKIDLQNPVRVQRAWEVLQQTGRGLAQWQADTPPPLLAPDQCARFMLSPPRDLLAERIAQRLRQMLAEGLMEEVAAMAPDWDPTRQSSRAIGAQEFIDAHHGRRSLEQALADAEIGTRQYAKRQRTWLRSKMHNWTNLLTKQ